jgi:hypothetical protein
MMICHMTMAPTPAGPDRHGYWVQGRALAAAVAVCLDVSDLGVLATAPVVDGGCQPLQRPTVHPRTGS